MIIFPYNKPLKNNNNKKNLLLTDLSLQHHIFFL